MAAMKEWHLLAEHLDHLSQEVSEYLLEATTPDELQYRKGFWDGHSRTKNLLNTLISLGEEGDATWMAKQLEQALEPFRTLTLRAGGLEEEQEAEEAVERLSRVLRAVEKEKAERRSSTGGSSTRH